MPATPAVMRSPDAAQAFLLGKGARRLIGDSRKVAPGDGFVAWPGASVDARRFVGDALARGAAACLVEARGVDAFGFGAEPRVAAVRGLKAAAGEIASRFLGTPSAKLDIVAVTGTNGKSSTAWWLAQALASLGRRAAVVGTLGIGEPPLGPPSRLRERAGGEGGADPHPGPLPQAGEGGGSGLAQTGLTTPDPIVLQTALAGFAAEGFAACAIEASSIGIVEHRLAGTRVRVAVFTNFTQDHLDYHGDMAAYWAAKAQLFAWPGLRAAVVNLDDSRGALLAVTLAGGSADVWTVSAGDAASGRGARLLAADVRHGAAGLAFTVREGGRDARVEAAVIGDYNVSNLLAVIGVLRALGFSLDDAAGGCATLTPVPGRMQRVVAARGDVRGNGPLPEVVVDYAHTPDALEKTLQALRPLAAARGGRLWCVFGCGGDRDPGKRPMMGAIARRLADRVVVTSDNPRSEPPERIIAQVLAGIVGHDEVAVIEDRGDAIAHAVGQAAPGDVVVVAGKGHEDHQEIAGVRQPFSDAARAGQALAHRSPVLTLAEVAISVGGGRLVGDAMAAGLPLARVHSDTRTLRAGELFVALRGDRFDANDFLAEAKAKGAAAAIAERGLHEAGLAGVEVADARVALGELSAAWRRRFTLPLVAVAGSNGKTTVTQMTAAILHAWLGDAAFATVGNYNNDIGVPLTLLRLRHAHRAGVVELGMNHPGEIARLAAIAAPTVGLVNNAQREHLEFMVSVDAVARENGAVIEALAADGIAVFPADDAHAPTWRRLAGTRRVVTFGDRGDCDVSGKASWQLDRWQVELRSPAGDIGFDLQIAGRHNVRNAFAAAAAALAAGAPLAAVGTGLAAFRPVRGRSLLRRIVIAGRERTLVDDSYNANPDSVRAAIDVLAGLPAPRWLVLGDMGEVGDQGPAFHREVGAYAAARGIESLWAAGPERANTIAPFAGGRGFADAAAVVAALAVPGEAPEFASVLVKGSLFMAMAAVVRAFDAQAARERSGDSNAA